MKGGFLTLLLVLAFGWTSCSNDDAVPGTEGGEDVTLFVDFQSAESMETKADADKTIKNRFIAAFRDGTCTGIASADDNSTKLKIKAKTGDVTFIAIANANEVLKREGFIGGTTLPTREQLKALTTTGLSSEEDIIKVTEETKKDIQLKDSTSSFHFRLFQLQAKVTFEVSVADQKGTFEVEKYSITGINQASDLVLSDTARVSNTSFDAIDLDNGTNPTFFTYERITDASQTKRLMMKVSGKLIVGDKTETKSYTMIIDPTSSNGGTIGIVHGWAYTVEGMIKVQNPSELIVTIKARPWNECGVDVGYGEGDK